MGIFKRRGIGIFKVIIMLVLGILALYLLFRGIINENITTGMQ